jgi:Ohr subfamily peroxiredoxin
MSGTTIYSTQATAIGGRNGKVASAEAQMDLALGYPKSMGGDGTGNNPEQLFAMGYSACFAGALGVVARNAKVSIDGAKVTATVHFVKEATGFSLAVDLKGELPGLDQAAAQKLMDEAHQVCPYSKATRGNIPVTLSVA